MTPATPTLSVESPGVGITLSRLSKVFARGRAVLSGIDLQIQPGEFVSILGPSGCGKSTLLRVISGLEPPTSGALSLRAGDPRHNADPASEISFVFQDAHLLPWRTVLENVALPLEFRGLAAPERRQRARQALIRVGLGDALTLFPNQLSGGMKMRVSLARAFVTQPRLLILDEPFAALDEVTRQRLDEQLRELWRSFGMTVVFVTHSITESVFLSQRVVLLSRRTLGVSLDMPIELPDSRNAPLRASVEFAKIVQSLQKEFEKLGA